MILVLLLTTILGLSSSSWLSVWLCLELSSMTFCFFMIKDSTLSKLDLSQPLKYFIVQVLGSVVILISSMMENSTLIFLGVMMKMGAWPFLVWFISVVQNMKMKSISLYLMMTLQKVLPCYLISFLPFPLSFLLLVIVNLLVSSTMMTFSLSIKSVVAISSVANSSWFIVLMVTSFSSFVFFFFSYSLSLFFLIYYLSEEYKDIYHSLQVGGVLVMMNMGGAPPFFFFWGKLLAVKGMLSSLSLFLVLLFILSACIFMFFYLRVVVPFFMAQSTSKQMILPNFMNNNMVITLMSCISFFSFLLTI